MVLVNNVDNTPGRITYGAEMEVGCRPAIGDFGLATIHLKAVVDTQAGGTAAAFQSDTDVFSPPGDSVLGCRLPMAPFS